MSYRHSFVLCAILGLLLTSWHVAEAQSVPSPYEFIDERQEYGFHIGSVPGNRGALELGPGDGILFGARFGYHISGPLALEANGFLLPTDRRIRVPGADSGIDDLGITDALIGGLDARIRFSFAGDRTWNRLAPFVTMGGGFAVNLQGRSELETEIPESVRFSFGPTFLGALSAGVRWLPTDRVTVRGEASVNYWKLNTPETFRLAGDVQLGQPVPDQEWSPVPTFSIGLAYRR